MEDGAKKKSSGSLSVGRRLDRIEAKLDKMLTDVAALKVRAGVWGAMGALGAFAALKLGGCT